LQVVEISEVELDLAFLGKDVVKFARGASLATLVLQREVELV
jgi:hypothetical protein